MTPHDPTKTLFRYALTPPEIPVGQTNTLTISVANQTGVEQACKQIAFTLPPQLSQGSISVSTTTGTWALSQSGPQGRYVAQPQGAITGFGAGQVVGFCFKGIEPSPTPGPVKIEVSELTDQTRPGEIDATLIDAKPAITAFTADDLYIAPGGEVTFSWGTYEADKVKLDWGDGAETFDGGPGSFKVAPQETITATLTATKTGGESRTAQLTVGFAKPEVRSFGTVPDPADVQPGENIALNWKTLHAERCRLSFQADGGSLEPLGEVPPNCDGYPRTVEHPGLFTLEAIGKGYTDPRQQPVSIWLPPTVTRISIEHGPGGEEGPVDPSAVTWQSNGASSAQLTGSGGTQGVTPGEGSFCQHGSTDAVFRLAFLSPSFGLAVVSIETHGEVHREVVLSCPSGLNDPGGQVRVDWRTSANTMSGQAEVGGQSIPIGGSESGSATVPLPAQAPAKGPLWSGNLADVAGQVAWQVEVNVLQSDKKEPEGAPHDPA